MKPIFELHKTDKGFHFNLKAKNSEIILTSESYTSKAGAKTGIASVKANSKKPSAYTTKISKDGQNYFTLSAENNEVIGVSEMYKAKGGMFNGIDSVMENAEEAEIIEVNT